MALNFRRQLNGLQFIPQNTITPTVLGEVRYNSTTNKLELFDGSLDPIVTENGPATITNKNISGNTATNLVNGSGTIDFNSSGTITVPNATDTLVGRNTTDTLTNKTIDAGSNTITGLSGANFAPIADSTIESNISGGSAAPSANTLSAIFNHVLSNTQGSIIYRNSSSWLTLSPGTVGQVLTTGGPAANPSWTTPSSGSGTVTQVNTGTGLTGGPVTTTGTISLASIANNTLLANTSGISAAPIPTTVSALLDSAESNTQGSLLYRNTSSWVALAPGTSGQFLETQGAGANPVWASVTVPAISVTSKIANYTILPTDGLILVNDNTGSFQLTLYTAIGNDGKIIRIKKTNFNPGARVQLVCVGGQLIDNYTAGVVGLDTLNEEFTLVSDGSNWKILNHKVDTEFVLDTIPIQITAVTTAPVKGTIVKDQVRWTRQGSFAYCEYVYQQSTTGSGTSGSGDYLITLPQGLTADTTIIPIYTTTGVTVVEESLAYSSFMPTTAHLTTSNGSAAMYDGVASLYSSTQFRVSGMIVTGSTTINTTSQWRSNQINLSGSNIGVFINIKVPILNWVT